MDINGLQFLILDVDGVLTDGRLHLGSHGEPTKAFCVQDGCAMQLWRSGGNQVAWLSGRAEQAVARRASELGIEWVELGVGDKLAAFQRLVASAKFDASAVVYVGDDLPDLKPMAQCGFPVAVANARPEVKRAAAYVTRRRGGDGAVAEVVEFLLRKQRRWSQALAHGI